MAPTNACYQVAKKGKLSLGDDLQDTQDDYVETSIGAMGTWQLWLFAAVFLVKIPTAWHQLNFLFTAPASVDFRCADNVTERCSPECKGHVFDKSVFTETIVSQWDLVCDRKQLANIVQMMVMLGILVGGLLFGYLSDRYGRRGPYVISIFLQGSFGMISAFVPWFTVYLVMRFVTAVAVGGMIVISFVYIMEVVGERWRSTMGILVQIPFPIGHLILALLGYMIRDWRHLQVAISAPILVLLIYYFLLPESPRWLLTVGKRDKVIAVLERAAEMNRLPTNQIEENVIKAAKIKSIENLNGKSGNIFDLFKTPNLRLRTIVMSMTWCSNGIYFFIIAQYLSESNGNIFVNVAISAVVQIPGILWCVYSVKKFGRKITQICSLILSSLMYLAIPTVPDNVPYVRVFLGTFGMFSVATSFTCACVYSGELFPTIIRNVGVGCVAIWARVGAMVAPFIYSLNSISVWLPPVIMAGVLLSTALLCFKMPETLGCVLPDTIDEAERFGNRKAKNIQGVINYGINDID